MVNNLEVGTTYYRVNGSNLTPMTFKGYNENGVATWKLPYVYALLEQSVDVNELYATEAEAAAIVFNGWNTGDKCVVYIIMDKDNLSDLPPENIIANGQILSANKNSENPALSTVTAVYRVGSSVSIATLPVYQVFAPVDTFRYNIPAVYQNLIPLLTVGLSSTMFKDYDELVNYGKTHTVNVANLSDYLASERIRPNEPYRIAMYRTYIAKFLELTGIDLTSIPS